MTEASPAALDASHCPLCGVANQCIFEATKNGGADSGPCWCVGMQFDATLLARVPQDQRNRACICAACVRAAKSA